MTTDAAGQLVSALSHAHAMEVHGLRLLRSAVRLAGDHDIAAIYETHLLQTAEHERLVAERLAAHGAPPPVAPVPELDTVASRSETPTTLAATAYAFESHEVAVYRLLLALARRADDRETVAVAQAILEQEETAAALVAATFERAVDVVLGEPATSPLVTPHAFAG
jgi:ferritin-like metal-binding protein YciE